MILGTCPKCSAKKLPVKNGQLVPHMTKGKPCDWGIPVDIEHEVDLPFLDNSHLTFYENMMAKLDVLEGVYGRNTL